MTSRQPDRVRRRAQHREDGVALICALMVTALLTMLGGALVMLLTTETLISTHYRAGQNAMLAADAALARAAAAVGQQPDWSVLLATAAAGLSTGLCEPSSPRIPDGAVLNLAQLTASHQSDTDAHYWRVADKPRWWLFICGPLEQILPVDPARSLPYVVVWIADDEQDADGDPAQDTNGVLLLHAEAFGASGARRSLDAIAARDASPGIRLLLLAHQ